MAARTETFPTQLIRMFLAPVTLGAVIATLLSSWQSRALSSLQSRARRPSMPRMSDEWRKNHGYRRDDWP